MASPIPRLLGYATVGAGMAAAGYVGLVTGACPLDLGVGRRVRPLGPQLVEVAAPRELVFDVIAEPYLGRAPKALADKLQVLERGSDMVLAAHFTPLGGRLGLIAQTVETVCFTPLGHSQAEAEAAVPQRSRHHALTSVFAVRAAHSSDGRSHSGRRAHYCAAAPNRLLRW